MSSASKTDILALERVSFSYEKDSPFIRDLSLIIGEGEFIGLLGANGSGKSTILKLASGILRPPSGSIHLWGKDLYAISGRDRAKLISYLPQTLDISVPFTVRELVSMGLYPYDIGAGLLLPAAPPGTRGCQYQIDLGRPSRTLSESRNISVVMAPHDINI